MNIDERLSFFQEMVSCNYPVYLWQYDSSMNLLHTNCPGALMASDTAALLNLSPTLLSHVRSGRRNPMILDTNFGLLWLAAFEYQQELPYRIHLLGPAFTGKDSHLNIKRKLDRYNLSVPLRAQIFRQVDSVPIIPSTTLIHYAVMLHYAVWCERISSKQVSFASGGGQSLNADAEDLRRISEEHRGVWLMEQRFLNCIREGSSEYKQAIEKSMTLSSGLKSDSDDALRHAKNNVLVLLTLCSRASMEGGLHPSIAYSLNDYYATRLEQAQTISEVSQVSDTMMEDYVGRVRQSKVASSTSPQIQSIMDYINLHIRDTISIRDLADRAGYTEYYFSHKFKQQTGMSVSEYIRQRRLEEAKALLSGTRLSIQEISDELSFGSRNYFYSCFLKATGMSPSEYREKYFKG